MKPMTSVKIKTCSSRGDIEQQCQLNGVSPYNFAREIQLLYKGRRFSCFFNAVLLISRLQMYTKIKYYLAYSRFFDGLGNWSKSTSILELDLKFFIRFSVGMTLQKKWMLGVIVKLCISVIDINMCFANLVTLRELLFWAIFIKLCI